MKKFINISELTKLLNSDNNETKVYNHVLRYWEKQFKQIRPKRINNRRYYSSKQVETIKTVRFLLKDNGMTINGVKNLLNSNINKLDVGKDHGLKVALLKLNFKNKSKKILDKIEQLKNNGKKVPS